VDNMKRPTFFKLQTVIFTLLMLSAVVLFTGCGQVPNGPTTTSQLSEKTHPPLDRSLITPIVTNFPPPKEIYFPVEKEPAKEYGQISLHGTLSINDTGYLRVSQDNEETALVIWPYGYGLHWGNGQLWISNTKGEKIQRIGDPVILNGRFAEKQTAEQRINHTLPDDCEGPYFLAGPR
jgi:hypothetical protein